MISWIISLVLGKPVCSHKFDYMKDMSNRDSTGMVSCICYKCGEMFRAECGLNLPGELVQRKEGNK